MEEEEEDEEDHYVIDEDGGTVQWGEAKAFFVSFRENKIREISKKQGNFCKIFKISHFSLDALIIISETHIFSKKMLLYSLKNNKLNIQRSNSS